MPIIEVNLDIVGKDDTSKVFNKIGKNISSSMKSATSSIKSDFKDIDSNIKNTGKLINKNISDGFKKSAKESNKFSQSASDALKKIGQSQGFKDFRSGINRSIAGFVSFGKVAGAAAVAVGTALTAMAVKTSNFADELINLQTSLNIPAEQLAAIRIALAGTDADLSTFQKSWTQLSTLIQKARNGNKEAIKLFQTLGLSFEQLAKEDAAIAMGEVIKAVNNVQDPIARTAIMAQLGARSFRDLAQAGSEFSDKYKAAMKDPQRLTQEQIEKAQQLAAGMQLLQEVILQQMTKLFGSFVEGESLSDTFKKIKKSISDFVDIIVANKDDILSFFKGLFATLKVLTPFLLFIGVNARIAKLVIGFVALKTTIGTIVKLIKSIPGAITMAGGIFGLSRLPRAPGWSIIDAMQSASDFRRATRTSPEVLDAISRGRIAGRNAARGTAQVLRGGGSEVVQGAIHRMTIPRQTLTGLRGLIAGIRTFLSVVARVVGPVTIWIGLIVAIYYAFKNLKKMIEEALAAWIAWRDRKKKDKEGSKQREKSALLRGEDKEITKSRESAIKRNEGTTRFSSGYIKGVFADNDYSSAVRILKSQGISFNEIINRFPDLNGKIPKFAKGGIVSRPTLGMIGEAGPEIILPLKQFGKAMRNIIQGDYAGRLGTSSRLGTTTIASKSKVQQLQVIHNYNVSLDSQTRTILGRHNAKVAEQVLGQIFMQAVSGRGAIGV